MQAWCARGSDGERLAGCGWAHTVVEQVAAVREPVTASSEVARFHGYLAERVGEVRPSVLYRRLRDEQGLGVSWGTFYRYVRSRWPEAGRPGVRVTVRLPDPPAGEKVQVDFFYAGRWHAPEEQRQRRLYAFLMTLGHSRHQFPNPVLAEGLLDRLVNSAFVLTLLGRSYRPRQRPADTQPVANKPDRRPGK